jgi:hypothetical protein
VGRDLLVGLAVGSLLTLLPRLVSIAAGWFRAPPTPLVLPWITYRFGPPVAWGVVIRFAGNSISAGMFSFTVAFVLSLVLRKPWLAWGAFVLFATALYTGPEAGQEQVAEALAAALGLAVLVGRFGLLATVASGFAGNVLGLASLTTDLSAWYAPQGVVVALVVVALAVYGFVVSVGAKRLALRGFFGDD